MLAKRNFHTFQSEETDVNGLTNRCTFETLGEWLFGDILEILCRNGATQAKESPQLWGPRWVFWGWGSPRNMKTESYACKGNATRFYGQAVLDKVENESSATGTILLTCLSVGWNQSTTKGQHDSFVRCWILPHPQMSWLIHICWPKPI